MTPIERFNKAEGLFKQEAYSEAAEFYLELIKEKGALMPMASYKMGALSNNIGQPLESYNFYYQALEQRPDIVSILFAEDHPNRSYVFNGKKEEQEIEVCPLCHNKEIKPRWCYPLVDAADYNPFFNPIRLWMYCESCHHVFAKHFSKELFMYNDNPRKPNAAFFGYYSDVLSKLLQFSRGQQLFEVGIGACECLLVAREKGYNTFGIDVIDKHVKMAREKFNLNVQTADFVEFKCDKKFDIIIMSDIIEHVINPTLVMKKACSMLNDDGAIWVSTPNFDSAFSNFAGHADAMKRQQYHLNYFSRQSFFSMINKCGLAPVDYNISRHYNGSMEVTMVKTDRLSKG